MAASVAPRLHVFMGPMWSGKTAALVSTALELAPRHSAGAVYVKHAVDTRTPSHTIASRTGVVLRPARALASLDAVHVAPHTLYAVDEAQFFGRDLIAIADRVAGAAGATLLLSGLDLDYARAPFGHVLALAVAALSGGGVGGGAARARVTQLAAVCTHRGGGGGGRECGAPAVYSQRLDRGGGGLVRVGGSDFYAPACAVHHVPAPVSAAAWGAPGGGGGAAREAAGFSAGVSPHSWRAAARSPSLDELLGALRGDPGAAVAPPVRAAAAAAAAR